MSGIQRVGKSKRSKKKASGGARTRNRTIEMMARNRFKQTLRVVRATDCATGAVMFFLCKRVEEFMLNCTRNRYPTTNSRF